MIKLPQGYDETSGGNYRILKKDGVQTLNDREIVALIAYLQRLGKDIKANHVTTNK